jgi:predicted outer membrane repeat protein
VNVVCTISGSSYFGHNFGGSVISAVSSNLTITGNLTVSDGHAFQGGGIRLDAASNLLLQEPLNARFINNSAQLGSAIFAQPYASTIQVVPDSTYSLKKLEWHKNTNSLHYD